MKTTLLIITLLLISSCSTLRRSKIVGTITGALTCGMIGAAIGKKTSPNIQSEGLNQMIGGTTGATICAVGGYYLGKNLYQSDPANFEDKEIKFESKNPIIQETLPESQHGINIEDLALDKGQETLIPLINDLPNSLKDKVKRQKVIRYQVRPQTINTKDGRTLYFSGGEAIEHTYQ